MALYVPEKHAAELRTGHSDHATMVMMGLAETYLLLGDFDAAERWRLQTIATARQSERLHDIGHVLVFAGCLHPAMAGRFEDMARSAAELKNLVTKDDLPSWRGHADLFSGLALMRRGEKEEGLVRARRGIKRLLDAHAFSNCWFILFAQACFENGRLDEAAEMLALVRPSLAQGRRALCRRIPPRRRGRGARPRRQRGGGAGTTRRRARPRQIAGSAPVCRPPPARPRHAAGERYRARGAS